MPTVEPRNYLRSLAEVISRAEFTDNGGQALASAIGFERVEALLTSFLPPVNGTGPFARGKVLLVGNGGSAAIASHVHNDLSKALGVRALTFNDVPLLTALSNDIEYNAAFEKNAELWSETGDLVIAISSSGRSENILRAVIASRANGSHVVTLSGFSPRNPLRQLGDINVYVPSENYGHVEVSHLALLHCVTDRIAARRAEETMVPVNGNGKQ